MSAYCKNHCQFIEFVPIKQVRYADGFRSCVKCEKGYKTDSITCICCKSRLRSNRRDKN